MSFRLRLFLAASLACVAHPSAFASAGATEPEQAAAATRISFPVLRADHTGIGLSAQSGSGETWAIGYRDESVVLRWDGRAWVTEERVAAWPTWAGSVAMAADPLNPAAVLSLWRTSNSREQGRGRYQLRRHLAGRPSVLLSDFVDPTGREDGSSAGPMANFTVDRWGQVWLTFPARWLVSIPAGGAPKVVRLADEFFEEPFKEREARSTAYTGTTSSTGWLWNLPSDERGKRSSRAPVFLSRPLWVENGEPRAERTLPNGLPTEPRVTLIRSGEAGATIWAVEGDGLWDVDATGSTATRRDSPPDAWRIVDWACFADGTELALVIDPVRRRDWTGSRIFVRRGGRWLDAGSTGAVTITLWHSQPAGGSFFDWCLQDDLLLGAGFGLGFVAVDLQEAEGKGLRVRRPGWREAVPVAGASRFYPRANGDLMILAPTSVLTTPAELRACWRAAELAGEPEVQDFYGNPHRAEDGRLWMSFATGEGGPRVRHWDGQRWHTWPLPEDYPSVDHSPVLWVDRLGRMVIFASRLDKPAWERSSAPTDAWRRHESGWKLIEARAADPAKAANVPPLGRPLWLQAAVAPDGRALVGERPDLWLWSEGRWTSLTKHAGGVYRWTYGFDAEGRPWSEFNGVRHVFGTDGATTTSKQEAPREDREMKKGEWPHWLKLALDEKEAVAARQDAEGVWWVSAGGELWKGWDGDVARVFADDERSPFRRGGRVGFHAVHVDPTGTRLFEADTSILLPPSKGGDVAMEWIQTADHVTDREGLVKGEGLHSYRWRIDGGEWRRQTAGAPLRLRELPQGGHVLEVVGVSTRLEPGPVLRQELRADYDPARRVEELLERLDEADASARADAVRRLAAQGAAAEDALKARIAAEAEDDRRWWLRAALQALEDRRDAARRTAQP